MLVSSRRAPSLTRSLQRGLFSSSVKYSIHRKVSPKVDNGGRRVVLFDDCMIDARWLWSNDAKWIHPTSGQRLKTPGDYPGSKILRVRVIQTDKISKRPPKGSCHSTGVIYKSNENSQDESLVLEVEWDDAGEPSYYFVSWLLEWTSPRQSSQVTRHHAIRRGQNLVQLDYTTVQKNEMERLVLYSALLEDGVALVRNCPALFDSDETTPCAVMGTLLAGSLSHGTLYGNVFHVQAMPEALNVAYTTIRLPPHQDLAYYESPPGLQLLHCVEQRGIVGGESTLVDGMAAAQTLREMAPDLFETLTTTQATFCKQREGADMVAYYPHIQLSQESNEIVAINWSPPFEGPLRNMSRCSDYYTAYAAFTSLVDKHALQQQSGLSPQLYKMCREYAEEHTFEKLLQEGDMLVFNNRRMLHGRKSFQIMDENGARHLVGTYTNMDETLNQYRLLMRKHGWRDGMLNTGNGTAA